jgi:serine/threonine protein kinase
MNWRDRFRKQKPEADLRGSPTPPGTKLRATEGRNTAIWTKGQSILGEYTVEGVLGEGGMGTVYLLVRSHFTGQRFAVKKTKFQDETIQRNFLRELQLWLDLPEHPHLVACRFFRTINEELAIFAEYVDGGPLTKWITERRLRELPHILDVAIQFAWGLHALHELGLVHQDVKPGNVLMTREGGAKVSDFGLARARAAAGERAAVGGPDILLSCGGMTEAYCSPEQAAFQSLTRKTDIWSWGVSVLEMFTGGVTWRNGVLADNALTAYVDSCGRAGVGVPGLPLMPVEMVPVLRKCFRPEPQDRWETMLEVADVLREMYHHYAEAEYARKVPAFLRSSERKVFLDERRTLGAHWEGPQRWLAAALKAEGRDLAEAGSLMPPREGSRRAQAVADLAGYDAARRIFERLVARGQKELSPELATLCMSKALIHRHLDDIPGALVAYDQALAILEPLVQQGGRRELLNELALTHMNKGHALQGQGNLAGAVAAYDQALGVLENLVGQAIQQGLVSHEGFAQLANELAQAYATKGSALQAQGNLAAARVAIDRALAFRERLVNLDGRRELAEYLAMTYAAKASLLQDEGDLAGAAVAYNQALSILERLVNHEGQRNLANELASIYNDKASTLQRQGDMAGAAKTYDQALAIWDSLVNHEKRDELASKMATAYMNKGMALPFQGDFAGGVAAIDQAIAIWERLVIQEGRQELANELAMTYVNKGSLLYALGSPDTAVAAHDQALAIQERLVTEEGRRDLANALADTYMNKGLALNEQGNSVGAMAAYDRALAIQERLVNEDGRRELRGDLARVQLYRASLLSDRRKRATEAKRAISVLEAEVLRTGRNDLEGALEWAAKRGLT